MNMLCRDAAHPRLRAFFSSVMLCLAGGLSQPAQAVFDPVNDDTDIFLANPDIPAQRPNVLLYVDNTANWGGKNTDAPFVNEKPALVNVVQNLTDQFNLGLMLFPETGSPNDNTDGGYVRFAIRQMDSTNKPVLAGIVNSFDAGDDKGNNATPALGMIDVYRYFAGLSERASNKKVKTDFANNNIYQACASCPSNQKHPSTAAALGEYALDSGTDGALYNSPITDSCEYNYLIYISNGPANENQAALDISKAALTAAGGNASTIPLTPTQQQGNWMDEWARFLHTGADLNGVADGAPRLTTYVVEVDPNSSTLQGQAMTALLTSTASVGGGRYFAASSANNASELVNALTAIFSEIQATNTVFASSTLPVSLNVRGTNLNQVYIGVFRPDAQKKPRWLGNLKMYQLGFDATTNSLFLADSTGTNAEGAQGFIRATALSFWTAASTFWGFRDAAENSTGGPSDSPDGELVEKGGVAQGLRTSYATSQTTRKLYTCTTGCNKGSSLSATPFAVGNTDITGPSVGLGTSRSVTSLSAFATKSISSLTDTRSISSLNTNTYTSSSPVTLSNGATAGVAVSSLTNSFPKTITGLSNNPTSVVISGISTSGPGGCRDTVTATTSTNHNLAVGTSFYIATPSTTNSQFNGKFTVSALGTGGNAATQFKYQPGGACLPNTAPSTINARMYPVPGTILTATVPNHGFTLNQNVTINASFTDASGTAYSIPNVTVPVGNPTTDTFTFTSSQYGPLNTALGIGGLASATAAGATTTATATTAVSISGNTGFDVGKTVRIAGATPAGYNGNVVITSRTSSVFTYTVPAGLSAPATGSITASPLGSTTVTATAVAPIPAGTIKDGQPVTISGAAAVPEYNNTFTANCGGTGADCINSFTFTTPAPLPATDPGSLILASTGVTFSNVATVTVLDHKFATGGTFNIRVQGADAAYDTPSSLATYKTANTFEYTLSTSPGPNSTSNPTVTLLDGSGNPVAFATIADYNFVNANGVAVNENGDPGVFDTATDNAFKITIKGATPTAYNIIASGLDNATVVDATTFKFSTASSTPLGPATGALTANLKTKVARATVPAHGLSTGNLVEITGASPAEFNKTSTSVTVLDNNTFTYPLTTAQGDASGGSIKMKPLASVTQATVDAFIRWVRGQDNIVDENKNNSLTDIRASIHGDVLHSRPAVVNYNRHGNDNDVYIFYGANDGIFRAVKGGTAQSAVGEPEPGQEAWGFIPPEHFSQLARLRNNEPLISSTNKKPYFADGSIGVYVVDKNGDRKIDVTNNSGDKVYLFISMHRGGRFIYALDVSVPTDPKLLWKHTNADKGWSELGQTWSVPQIHTINWSAANSGHPVLIFGAGYDPEVEDVDTATITNVDTTTGNIQAPSCPLQADTTRTCLRSMGRGVFIVDAITGDIIWQASGRASGPDIDISHQYVNVPGMVYAMPSDAAVIASVNSALRNRAYIGDTGGNLWRIDFDDVSPANWSVSRLATVGIAAGGAVIPDDMRKFLFPPDVVHDDVGFDAVLIGSGDREHPFETVVDNRMYMFKDMGSGPRVLPNPPVTEKLAEADLFDATNDCIQDQTACTGSGDQVDSNTASNALANADGWFISLGTGEKLVGSVVTLNNVTFFNTNQPTAEFNADNPDREQNAGGTCGSDLGVALQYRLRYSDAIAVVNQDNQAGLTTADRFEVYPGGGYLPSPVPVTVIIDGQVHEGVISGTSVTDPPGTTLGARLRKYWYKEFE